MRQRIKMETIKYFKLNYYKIKHTKTCIASLKLFLEGNMYNYMHTLKKTKTKIQVYKVQDFPKILSPKGNHKVDKQYVITL